MQAYHFLKEDMRAGSGKEKSWKVGEERTVPKPDRVSLCAYGYHSASSWRDALSYAPGPVACIVEVSDPINKDDTKQVSATRKLLAAKDVSKELRLFACDCAERALKRERKAGREPDERSWKAIIVSRLYANGEANLQELAAAWVAAWAAGAAAWAAGDAAWAAAWAAGDAAWAAEIKWQRNRLARYLDAVFAEGNL